MDQYYVIAGVPPYNKTVELYLRYHKNSNKATTLVFDYASSGYNGLQFGINDIIQVIDSTTIQKHISEDPDNLSAIIASHFKIYDSVRLIEAPERPIFLFYDAKKKILRHYFENIWFDIYSALVKERGLNHDLFADDFQTFEDYEKASNQQTLLRNIAQKDSTLKIKVNAEVVNAFQFLWDFFKFRATPEN